MSTLEETLEDEGYARWVQAGTCLGFVKKGLEKFAEAKSDVLFNRVKLNLVNELSKKTMCKDISVVMVKKKWQMSCHKTGCKDCQLYIKELSKCCTGGFTFETSQWENSIIDEWPTKGWQMAKLYMNKGQDKNVETVEETDLSGILNFIDHCSVARLAIADVANLEKVRVVRNKVMHSSTFKLSQQQFQDFTATMTALLRDQTALRFDKGAESEVEHIREASGSDFTITTDAEFRVLRDRALELQRQNKSMQDNISQMQTNCDELEGKDDEESQRTLAEVVKDIEEQEQKLEELDTTFSKLSYFALRNEDLKAKMKPHTASTSTALYGTSEMLTKVRKSYRLLTKQELNVIEKATDQCQTLEEKNRAFEELAQPLVAENEDIKTEKETRIKQLQQEKDDLKQNLREMSEKCDSEIERANQLKDELEAVKREKYNTELEIEKAREEANQFIAEKTKQAILMEELKEKNYQLQNELSEKHIKQDAMLTKIKQVSAENEQLKQQIEALNDCIKKEKQKSALNLKEAERLTKTNQEIEVELEQLQRKLVSCEEDYKSALTIIKHVEAELKTTKQEKNSNEFEIRMLLADIDELIAKKLKQDAFIEELENELFDKQSKQNIVLQEMEKMNEENKLLKETASDLNDSITKAEQKIETLTRRNYEMEVHIGELYSQIDKLKDRLTNADRNNEINQREIETLSKRKNELESKLKYAYGQLGKCKENLSLTETEKKQLEKRNGLLSTELRSVKGLNSQYKKDVDGVYALKQQNDMLRKTDTTVMRVWCLSVILYVVVFVIVYWDEVSQM